MGVAGPDRRFELPAGPPAALDFGPFALEATPPPIGAAADGYGPRRMILDKILIDAAAAAGAEVR